MLAIISDIHSNTEALQAVLADIAKRNVERIICLGDIVGYGPDPVESVELVSKHASVTLMGNHDLAVVFEPAKFNIAAESSCFWTRQRIDDEKDTDRRNACWDFLGNLLVKYTVDGNDFGMGEL
ncbi:MAG: metallophosphoesterase family protein, partial [Planctomycetota bacterium]